MRSTRSLDCRVKVEDQLRAWSSRIMLCSQKNEATRTPRVIGVTVWRLEAG